MLFSRALAWQENQNNLNQSFGIWVAILFLVERYKILLLINMAALSRYSDNLSLFICGLVASDWIIYSFHFSRLSLANLLMGKSINICGQYIDGRHPKHPPSKKSTQGLNSGHWTHFLLWKQLQYACLHIFWRIQFNLSWKIIQNKKKRSMYI